MMDFVTMIWFYLTPVFYDISMVPEGFRAIYILNPMVGIISSYKNILLYDKTFLTPEFYIAVFSTIVIFFAGVRIFAGLNKRIGELI
jgi:ABC-type polysaccharide/polyol phosphate export permease